MLKAGFILLSVFLLSISVFSGEGHDAGRQWAEDNDVDSCGGNSSSFIAGCEEYLEEKEAEERAQEEENSEESWSDF